MIVARAVFVGATKHLRYRLCEWVFASIQASFAFRLLRPGETFASSLSYAFMASWASESHWGIFIAAVAGFRLLALGLNGNFAWFKPFSPFVRALTAWISSTVWFCLALGFYLSNPDATGWTTYGVILIADIALSIMIMKEVDHPWRRLHADA